MCRKLIPLLLLAAAPGTYAQQASPSSSSSDSTASITVWQTSDDVRDFYNFNPKSLDNVDDSVKIPLGFWPHPYVAAEISDMPAGYALVAEYAEMGFNIESQPGIAQFYFGYDNGRKTDDNDQPNPKGHDRYLHGGMYWRLSPLKRPKWFAGGGYRWSQLSTTNYTKGGSRPFFGARYDLYYDHSGSHPDCGDCWLSVRFGLDYFTAGSDWQNGSHGIEFSVVMPRPIEKRHAFLNVTFDVIRFHQSVTEPENAALTSQQRSQYSIDGTMSAGILYRFW